MVRSYICLHTSVQQSDAPCEAPPRDKRDRMSACPTRRVLRLALRAVDTHLSKPSG